ncbi:hypothetical protein BASA81_003234 [Batrachochytrium salamandrivorans]|nr:hypothetical protein BASA81_003234 [Batrachochytrium salamandrivorans]
MRIRRWAVVSTRIMYVPLVELRSRRALAQGKEHELIKSIAFARAMLLAFSIAARQLASLHEMQAGWLLLGLALAVARVPDRSTRPVLLESDLELVAALPHRPSHLQVIDEHVLFAWDHPELCRVCELTLQASFVPFANQTLFAGVATISGLTVSPNKQLVYVLTEAGLLQFDLTSQRLLRTIGFPFPVRKVNAVVLSRDENFAFAMDKLGVISVNLVSGAMYRPLYQHESVRAVPDGNHVNTVAISPSGNVVYFARGGDSFMWMVPTSALVMGAANAKVDIAFPKPSSNNGAVVDEGTGVLFLADDAHNALWMTNPDQHGRHKTLLASPSWLHKPTALAIAAFTAATTTTTTTAATGHKTYLYCTASSLSPSHHHHILRVDIGRDFGFASNSGNDDIDGRGEL